MWRVLRNRRLCRNAKPVVEQGRGQYHTYLLFMGKGALTHENPGSLSARRGFVIEQVQPIEEPGKHAAERVFILFLHSRLVVVAL